MRKYARYPKDATVIRKRDKEGNSIPQWMNTFVGEYDAVFETVTSKLRQYYGRAVAERPSYRDYAHALNLAYGTSLTKESVRDFIAHERRKAGS